MADEPDDIDWRTQSTAGERKDRENGCWTVQGTL